jgi:type II secretory pathway component PulF
MSNSARSPVKVEHLIALNDEIATLVRVGVPLELGLKKAGYSTIGGLSRLSQRLAERMESGSSLQEALHDEGDRIPGVYRAIVEAGIRAGRLSEALESASDLARSLLELHRRVVVAILYPAFVLLLTYLLLVGVSTAPAARFLEVSDSLRMESSFATRLIEVLHNSVLWWGLGIPAGVVIFVVLTRLFDATRASVNSGRLIPWQLQTLDWLPWVSGVRQNYDRATFCRVLQLLVRHETPLPEALMLAGYATGDRRIVAAMNKLANRLEGGESLESALGQIKELPAFLTWIVSVGSQHGSFDVALDQAAGMYHKRAERNAERVRVTLPLCLTIGLGGVSACIYCLVLMLPIIHLYSGLADPLLP